MSRHHLTGLNLHQSDKDRKSIAIDFIGKWAPNRPTGTMTMNLNFMVEIEYDVNTNRPKMY